MGAADRVGWDVGVYRKFDVKRADGSSEVGGKHEHCIYFVLDWRHDPFAIPAARAYADACEAKYPALASDLRTLARDAELLHLSREARCPACGHNWESHVTGHQCAGATYDGGPTCPCEETCTASVV